MNNGKVKCTCGWSWNKSDSSKKDMYVCHECGRDNSNNMKNGGWLDSYADGGSMQEHQENYNDNSVSLPEGYVGEGYNTKGRDYSPAWGGQFQMGGSVYPVNYVPQAQMGGSIPGAVGFSYARTNNPAPSNGPYAKKTMASAQNGTVKESTSVNRDRRIPSVKDVIKKVPGTKAYKDVYGNLLEKDDDGVYKPRQKEKEEVRKHVPQSKLSKAKEIALNPMTAAGYKVRNEDIPDNFSSGERNNLDTAVDFINPVYYAESAKNLAESQGQVFSDLSEGNFGDAALNQTMAGVEALNFIPIAKGAKPFVQKGMKQLGNIKTSISPELRQGLRANGFSEIFKSKPKSEINWGNWNKEIPDNPQLMKEYDAIEQTTKANGSWMKNPDGSAFQGTPEQFVQQNSENFKKAFGNTKVRDVDGNIQIANHSTNAEFDEFDLSKFGTSTDDGFYGKGVYFHPKTNNVALYGDKNINAYLNIENPMPKDIVPYFGREGKGSFWNEDYTKQTVVDDVSSLWKNKHDGVITDHLEKYGDFNSTEYVTNPKNIKSAIGNNGMFDMTNPNIYKSVLPIGLGLGAASQIEQKKQGGIIKDDRGQWAKNKKNLLPLQSNWLNKFE